MPDAVTQVISSNGIMHEGWYRFFHNLWLKNNSGIANNVTLGTLQNQAQAAQATGTAATNTIAAESQRAQGAENQLQANITAVNNSLTTTDQTVSGLQTQLGSVSFGAVASGAPGAAAGVLHLTINGTSYVLQLYSP